MAALLDALKQTQTIAMLVGLAVLMMWETAPPFFEYFQKAPKERGKHALRNLLLGGLNAGLISVVFVGLWGAVAIWTDQQGIGLLHWLATATGLPTWGHAFGAVLLLDAWMYVWHRINHVIPFLWRFHRVHHNDPTMDVTTASRFHTGEIALSSALRLGVILLLGIHLWELVLYETLMFAVVQFHHANVKLPNSVDRALRTVIVTPDMHKVHHSRYQPETDSNYSSLFSFWDRLGQSFRLREDPSTIELGLHGWDGAEDQSVLGMLRAPVKRTDVASIEAPPEEADERALTDSLPEP
ncbi:MAG: sterol desaturase family protein [Salinibacter sp.]